MSEDAFRWAETLAIYRKHGDQAASWIVGRVASLAREGDEAGVERFRQIATKLDQLLRAELSGSRH